MNTYFFDRFSKQLTDELNKILNLNLESKTEPLIINIAPEQTGADYALPLFNLAKKLNLNPGELANKLQQELKLSIIKKTEPAGGFLNIFLNPQELAAELSLDLRQNKTYGFWPNLNRGKTAVCDYPSPDIAKPLSVGHLRPALQGQAIDKLLQATGYKTISDNHLGDAGRSFGIRVVGFKKYSSDQKLKEGGIYELANLYVKISADLKAEKGAGEAKLNNEIQGWLIKLEEGDKEALNLHKKFTEVSIEHMDKVFGRLGVTTDLQLGESFYIKRGQELVNKLLEDGTAEESNGAVIVKLNEFGIETPIMIRKSNGASLYAATDLATIEYRDKNFSPSMVFICAGSEQKFYFQQLEALRKKIKLSGEIYHVYWGLINQTNSDGTISKMSSREGVVYLEELLDKAEEIAKERTESREVSQDDITKIALGAIKFNDFAQDRKTNILFDWDRMFSLQGFSGPFVQYAAVRINSILSKLTTKGRHSELAEESTPYPLGEGWYEGSGSTALLYREGLKEDFTYSFDKESKLLLKLSQFPQVIKTAAERYEPHHLATYAFELAKELNRYYEEVHILSSSKSQKQARVWLLKFTYQVLETALKVLGIEIPSKM